MSIENEIKLKLWENSTLVNNRHSQETLCSDPAHTCNVELFPPWILSVALLMLSLCLLWKKFQLQWLTFWKPHRLLQAKSYIQAPAESPTEINGHHAGAFLCRPHLPSVPSILPACLLSTTVTASQQSTLLTATFWWI